MTLTLDVTHKSTLLYHCQLSLAAQNLCAYVITVRRIQFSL